MINKISFYSAVFLAILGIVLIFILNYTFKRIDALKNENNSLKIELLEKDTFIKEMEKVNELYAQATKENEKFRQKLANDSSDNLSVRPASYILDRMHED